MNEYWAQNFLTSRENIINSIKPTLDCFFFPNITSILSAAIIIAGIFLLLKRIRKPALIVTLPLFVLLLLSALGKYPFAYRLTLFCLPLLIIYFCAILDTVSKKHLFVSILTITLCALSVKAYFTYYPQVILKRNIYLREELRTLYEYLQVRIEPDDIILTTNDMYQQNKYYMRKFKFGNEILEKREGKPIPFDKMLPGKRYRVIYDCYWKQSREKDLPQIVEWLSKHTIVLEQYEYNRNYVFYVQKLP